MLPGTKITPTRPWDRGPCLSVPRDLPVASPRPRSASKYLPRPRLPRALYCSRKREPRNFSKNHVSQNSNFFRKTTVSINTKQNAERRKRTGGARVLLLVRTFSFFPSSFAHLMFLQSHLGRANGRPCRRLRRQATGVFVFSPPFFSLNFLTRAGGESGSCLICGCYRQHVQSRQH